MKKKKKKPYVEKMLVETTEMKEDLLEEMKKEELKEKTEEKEELKSEAPLELKSEGTNNHIDEKDWDEDTSYKGKEKSEKRKIQSPKKPKSNPFLIPFLLFTLLLGFVYLGTTFVFKDANHYTVDILISRLILLVFSILFVLLELQIKRRKNGILFSSITVLFVFFTIGILTTISGEDVTSSMTDLRGKTLTEVLTWAKEKKIEVDQEYEYSDMVEEYRIISQDIPIGENLKEVKSITVAVSEGANPYKEIIIPSMIGWDSERVINYVEENYLSNVEIEFVSSEKQEDTVIEQSKMGSVKRDEEIKLTFSYGEKRDGDEVKLIDLTNKSKFRAIFYLKQQGLKYDTKEEFSNKIKKGYVKSQDKEPGTMINRENDHIEVTISKGNEIKVPDLKKMDLSELTEWIIKNKLKLTLLNEYDEKVKEGNVIKASVDQGDTLSEGSVVEVTISKGQLKMPAFNDLDAFKKWADTHNISYQEEHEFNNDIEAGKVIRYSYKTGDTIKNSDTIIVTISDGKELKVPNLSGMSKQEAINALKNLGLNYNFISRSSSKVAKDKVMDQSIEPGSSVSSGTTITVTLSSGKGSSSSSSEKNTSSGSSSSNSSQSSQSSSSTPSTPKEEKPSCDTSKKQVIYIQDAFIDYEPATTCANIKKAYPNHQFSCSYQKGSGLRSGFLINVRDIDEHEFNYCDTITLKIAQD